MAEDEIEYESDPEEVKLSLKSRRREASDDEEKEDEEEVGGTEEGGENPLTRKIQDSEGESEGAAADYDDDEFDDGEDEDYDLDDYVDEEEEVGYGESGKERGGYDMGAGKYEVSTGDLVEEKAVNDTHDSGEQEINGDNNNAEDAQEEEEKKEVEPFAVPTAGAFYMHDDRFRESLVGRNRRTLGGRKLWESRDDRKWGHDKFEELKGQERHHEEGRRGSRGRFRGRGRSRGTDRGYAQRNKPREHPDNSTSNHNDTSKVVRGRGSRRYQPSSKNNNEVHLAQSKEPGNLGGKTSSINSARTSALTLKTEGDVVLPKKQVASNLSVASPPFYPSGSSTKDNTYMHKKDVQAGTVNRNNQTSALDVNFTNGQSSATIRGKNSMASAVDKLYIDNSSSAMSGKPLATSQGHSAGFSSSYYDPAQFKGQRRGAPSMRQMAYQPVSSNNQVNSVPPSQPRNLQKDPTQNRAQSFGQQLSYVPRETQGHSTSKETGALNAFDFAEIGSESQPESSKQKTALVGRGRGSIQGSGRGSFHYGGAPVTGVSGNMVSGLSDQNFPTFLPVMQFRGQHRGGVGVPAVGMAFPGYVGQPQAGGRGSSEMTWLPVLAGAAGALGANFCPPYMSVDGSYQARPTGQVSSSSTSSSQENNAAKVGNDWKPAQRPDVAGDDFGQRQKNPRRYTEMKFDQ